MTKLIGAKSGLPTIRHTGTVRIDDRQVAATGTWLFGRDGRASVVDCFHAYELIFLLLLVQPDPLASYGAIWRPCDASLTYSVSYFADQVARLIIAFEGQRLLGASSCGSSPAPLAWSSYRGLGSLASAVIIILLLAEAIHS